MPTARAHEYRAPKADATPQDPVIVVSAAPDRSVFLVAILMAMFAAIPTVFGQLARPFFGIPFVVLGLYGWAVLVLAAFGTRRYRTTIDFRTKRIVQERRILFWLPRKPLELHFGNVRKVVIEADGSASSGEDDDPVFMIRAGALYLAFFLFRLIINVIRHGDATAGNTRVGLMLQNRDFVLLANGPRPDPLAAVATRIADGIGVPLGG